MIEDIVGKTFNHLYVEEITDNRNSYGQILYKCKCLLCGKERLATKSNLKRGEIKDCGNHHKYTDITGKIYGHLKVIKLSDDQSRNGKGTTKIWDCECLLCGSICRRSYGDLKYGNCTSCGCKMKTQMKELVEYNTNPSLIKARKIPSTNTSGVMGVSFDKSRGKWAANIAFQGVKYRLGRYDNKEDAIAVRKKAEEYLFDNFLEWYESQYPGKLKNKKSEKIQKLEQITGGNSMLKEFKHYGVTVFFQVVEGQTFKQALRKAGVDYVDLPIMLPVGIESIRYEKDGVARYACTKDGDDCQMVYITDRIPDDLDLIKLMTDVDGQRNGDEPERMETKLQKLIREATQRVAEEKGNTNLFTMPDDPEPAEVRRAITAMFGYDRHDLEEMDASGIDPDYFAELVK